MSVKVGNAWRVNEINQLFKSWSDNPQGKRWKIHFGDNIIESRWSKNIMHFMINVQIDRVLDSFFEFQQCQIYDFRGSNFSKDPLFFTKFLKSLAKLFRPPSHKFLNLFVFSNCGLNLKLFPKTIEAFESLLDSKDYIATISLSFNNCALESSKRIQELGKNHGLNFFFQEFEDFENLDYYDPKKVFFRLLNHYGLIEEVDRGDRNTPTLPEEERGLY